MKKMIFALFVGLTLVSCGAFKKTTSKEEPKPEQSQKMEVEKVGAKLQPLTQSYVSDLSEKDSTLFFTKTFFFNSAPINLELIISDKDKPFSVDEKGIAHKSNIDVDIVKTVPEMTAGKIMDHRVLQNDPTVLGAFLFTFDLDDKTYQLKFFRQSDGSFLLSANAVLIYEGKSYPVSAKIPLKKDCIILFYGDETPNTIPIRESAKGFNSSSGGSLNEVEKKVGQKKVEEIW